MSRLIIIMTLWVICFNSAAFSLAAGEGNAKPLSSFACNAEYFNNLTLEGQPALIRQENSIQKLSFNRVGAAAKVEGLIGWGFGFDGQSSVRINNSPGYGPNEDFAWSFWVKLKDPIPDKQASFLSGNIRQRIAIDITPRGTRFFIHNGRREAMLNYEVPPQQWVSVTVMRRNDKLSVWLNGQLKAETEMPGSIPAVPLKLGGNFKGDKNAACIIDEFCMYNRALSEDEIHQIADKKDIAQGRTVYLDGEDPMILAKQRKGYDGIADTGTMSARWTGVFVPRMTGKYHFVVSSNGGVRLFVDDKNMIDQMQAVEMEAMDRHCEITLEKGRQYNVKIEYANLFGKLYGDGGFVIFEYVEPMDVSGATAETESTP